MIQPVNHNNCIFTNQYTYNYAVKNTTIHISPCNLCCAQRMISLLSKKTVMPRRGGVKHKDLVSNEDMILSHLLDNF